MELTKANINNGQLDTLICLVENQPVYDGDLPSKTARTELITWGYAEKCECNGQQGYQRATEKGRRLYMDIHNNAKTVAEGKAYRIMQQELRYARSAGR